MTVYLLIDLDQDGSRLHHSIWERFLSKKKKENSGKGEDGLKQNTKIKELELVSQKASRFNLEYHINYYTQYLQTVSIIN